MPFLYPNTVIQVFCKAPEIGRVKTRLMPELTAQQATDVHKQLTLRTLNLLTSTNFCPIQLCCSPSLSHPFFIEMGHVFPLELTSQSSGDLGERMHQSFKSGFKKFKHVVLIGCDCVSLTVEDLNCAFQALTTDKEIVIAPAEDGGYCLIGMNSPHKEVFTDISWGTDTVLDKTRKKISTSGLNCLELKTQWDVDNYADYQRFLKREY